MEFFHHMKNSDIIYERTLRWKIAWFLLLHDGSWGDVIGGVEIGKG